MYYSSYIKCCFINECDNAKSNLCNICIHNKIKKEYDYLKIKKKGDRKMNDKNNSTILEITGDIEVYDKEKFKEWLFEELQKLDFVGTFEVNFIEK